MSGGWLCGVPPNGSSSSRGALLPVVNEPVGRVRFARHARTRNADRGSVMWWGEVRSTSGSGKLVGVVTLFVLGSCLAGCGGRSDTPTSAPQIGPRSLTIRTGSARRFSGGCTSSPLGHLGEGRALGRWSGRLSAEGIGQRPLSRRSTRTPVALKADAGWLMSARATPAQVDQYLARRNAPGFNSLPPRNGSPGWIPDGAMRPTAGEVTSARDAGGLLDCGCEPRVETVLGVDRLDHRQGSSARHGRHARLRVSRLARRRDRVVRRHRRPTEPPRVVRLGCVDRQPVQGQGQSDVVGARRLRAADRLEGAARARAIAGGIKSTGARQLFMAEASPPDSVPSEVGFRSILDQNSFYGYGPDGRGAVYETADRAWTMSPTRPAWMQEGTARIRTTSVTSARSRGTRRGRFWSVLAGGTAGDGFGSVTSGNGRTSPVAVEPRSRYSTYAFELFDSLPWWESSRPARTRSTRASSSSRPATAVGRLWTTYVGTHVRSPVAAGVRSRDRVGANLLGRHVRAGRADTRALVRPHHGQLHRHQQRVRLREPPNPQVQHARKRGDGTDDWVLVLDSTGSPRCGTITTSGRYTVAPTGVGARSPQRPRRSVRHRPRARDVHERLVTSSDGRSFTAFAGSRAGWPSNP